jgi:hypothetical protein
MAAAVAAADVARRFTPAPAAATAVFLSHRRDGQCGQSQCDHAHRATLHDFAYGHDRISIQSRRTIGGDL